MNIGAIVEQREQKVSLLWTSRDNMKEEQAAEIEIPPTVNPEFTMTDAIFEQLGVAVVSEKDYNRFRAGQYYTTDGTHFATVFGKVERRKKNRKVLLEEASQVAELQQKYPVAKMHEIIKANPRPTIVD